MPRKRMYTVAFTGGAVGHTITYTVTRRYKNSVTAAIRAWKHVNKHFSKISEDIAHPIVCTVTLEAEG